MSLREGRRGGDGWRGKEREEEKRREGSMGYRRCQLGDGDDEGRGINDTLL